MDIVDACAGSFFEKYVKRILEGSDLKLCGGMLDNDKSFLAFDNDGYHMRSLGDGCLGLCHAVFAGIEIDLAIAILLGKLCLEPVEELGNVDVEYDPVDGLKYYAVIMDVFKLDKGITSGMILALFLSEFSLALFPICLGGCEAVVAIAHCEEQGRHFGAVLVGIDKSGKCVDNVGYHSFIVYQPAFNMAAVHHEIEIIELLDLVKLLGNGLDNGLLIIIDENEDVGKLERCAVTNLQTGRDTLDDGTFSCTDKGSGALGIVVAFEIESYNKTVPDLAVNGTAGEYKAFAPVFKGAVCHVVVHCLADCYDALRFTRLFKLDLGEHQPEGRGCITDDLLNTVPIIGLGCVLVAGNACPLGQINLLAGHHKLGNTNADIVLELGIHNRFSLRNGFVFALRQKNSAYSYTLIVQHIRSLVNWILLISEI